MQTSLPGSDHNPAGDRPGRRAYSVAVFIWLPALIFLTLVGAAITTIAVVIALRSGLGKHGLTLGIGLFFLIAGLCALVWLLNKRASRQQLRREGLSTVGQVTAQRLHQMTKLTTQSIDYQFNDRDGATRTGQFMIGGRFNPNPPRFEVGDAVEVIYLPGDPSKSTPAISLYLEVRC